MDNRMFNGLIPRLPVTDLRRTVAFYADRLGFVVSVAWPEDQPTFCILERDAVDLGFFTPEAYAEPITIGTAHLYIAVDDVDELHESLRAMMPIEWGPEDYFYGRREFAVRDPDGYLLIFTQPVYDSVTRAG